MWLDIQFAVWSRIGQLALRIAQYAIERTMQINLKLAYRRYYEASK